MGCGGRIASGLLALTTALLFVLPTTATTTDDWTAARAVMADFDAAWADAGTRFGAARSAGDDSGQAVALQDLELAVAHALESLPPREDCMGLWWDAAHLRLEAWGRTIAAFRATDAESPARNNAYGMAASGLYVIAPYLAVEVEC